MRKLKNILEPFLIFLMLVGFGLVMAFPIILTCALNDWWPLTLYWAHIFLCYVFLYGE